MSRPDVEDIYPLTPLQQGMLFHTVYAPGSGAYVEQVGFTVRDPAFDPDALARAWQRVADRHPALRTAFAWEEMEEPVAVVQRRAALPVEKLDWSGLDPAERERELEAFLAEDRRRGFDLLAAPLMRLALVRAGAGEWRVQWSFHHLLLDGWSLPRVLDEVLTFDADARAGRETLLPRPRPFRDYVLWLQGRDPAAAEAFWRGRLAGVAAPTPLGIDRPAPAGAADDPARWAEETVSLTADVMAGLASLARRARATPATLVQGAWALLLSRYAGQDDVVFGAVVSGRPAELPGVEEMVGMFINTLPVRARVDEDAPLLPWIAELHARQVEAGAWEHVSLTAVQGWTEVPREQRLFESILAFENYPVGGGAGAPDGRLRIHDPRVTERTGYPLTLVASPGDGLALRAIYDAARFSGAAVRRMLAQWGTLLEAMAADPERPLRDLPLLTPVEREAAVAAGAPLRTEWPAGRTVTGLLAEAAARDPDAVAVAYPDAALTWRELDRRAGVLAARLRDAGVGPDARVGLLVDRSCEMIVGMVAVLRAGGAYVPLDPQHPPDRLAWMLQDCGARVLLAQESLRDLLPAAGVEVISFGTGLVGEPGAAEAPAATGSGEAESGSAGEAGAVAVAGCPLSPVTCPLSLAYVIYTSGSTGTPKGVAVTHAGILRLVRDTDYTETRPDDRVAQISNAAFDGSTWEIWSALLAGARLVGIPRETALDPDALAAALRAGGVTQAFLPTALFHRVAGERPDAFAGLRYLVVGGEAMDPVRSAAVLESGGPAMLVNGYGPTEGTTFSTWHPVNGDEDRAAPLPLGRPVANTGAYVLDARLEPVPPGVPGELYLSGPGLARGYLARPALTAERFVPHPFAAEPGERLYRTGDRVRWSEEGALEFLGRADQQVKVRGFRVEPGEIEAALLAHPGVRAAAVVAREDGPGERRLVGYVVAADGAAPEDAELRDWLRARLPEHMVPAALVPLESLPLTPNGKLDRRALPAPELGAGPASVPPRDDVEAVVAAIWSEVLEVPAVGALDSFFDLGGHSLLATQVISRVREALQVEVPLRVLFEEPTVAALAAASVALEAEPGQTQTVARILRMLDTMSEEEMQAISAEELEQALRASHPSGEGST
jgi:amino acid adenylation domain-containing protein